METLLTKLLTICLILPLLKIYLVVKNFKKLKKKSILVVGDSLLNDIEESKLSKSRHIRVQPISGGKIIDIERNLNELLNPDLKLIIIHIGTNHSSTENEKYVLQGVVSLKEKISLMLPNCKVVISNLIVRTDDVFTNNRNEKVNKMLRKLDIDILENNNIKEKHLGKRGLHLNAYGNALLFKKLLNIVRR